MEQESSNVLTPSQRQFWEEVVALAIQFVCLVEREQLDREYTTAELRKAGKRVLTSGQGK